MSKMMLVRSIVVLATLLFGTVASAETLGRITASIDGGAEKTWFVTIIDGKTQSDWLQIMPGSLNMSAVNLWGNPDEGQFAATKDALVLGITIMRQPGGMIGLGEVQYLENGFSEYWSTDDSVNVKLDELSADGDMLTISGSFAANATLRQGSSGTPANPPQNKSIVGTFAATVSK